MPQANLRKSVSSGPSHALCFAYSANSPDIMLTRFMMHVLPLSKPETFGMAVSTLHSGCLAAVKVKLSALATIHTRNTIRSA